MMLLCSHALSAQGNIPFAIDTNYKPQLSYLQSEWIGTYIGMDPNAKIAINVERTLSLNPDLSFTNETRGHIGHDTPSFTLKHEEGTYTYDSISCILTYNVCSDSTLDMMIYIGDGELHYVVNCYDTIPDNKPVYDEAAQFTPINQQTGERAWVLFDTQLTSMIDPNKPAVYTMTTCTPKPNALNSIEATQTTPEVYNIDGTRVTQANRGLHIINGKKYIIR